MKNLGFNHLKNLRNFKFYRTTPHIIEGVILEHRRTLLSEWNKLYTFNNKTEAENGIKKHKETSTTYY